MQDIQVAIELGVDLMKDIVAAGYSFLKDKNRERDFFGAATKKYVGSLIERYNNVKVLGMREPAPLKSLYVRVNILEKISAEHRGLRLEDLEKAFNRDRRNFGKTTEPVDGEIIANRLERFIVLGKPGTGKTTYLRFLALMMLDPNSGIEHRRLPIIVTLHDWAQKTVQLMDYLTEQFDICGFEEARSFVKRMLEQGKCLVLFDGLDEVIHEADQDGIIRQIRDFTDKYSDNQFIISCRVAAYNHWFERFTDVEIADFNDEQIETFIRNWFHGQPKSASDCWERLKANHQLRELASVPLLLTLLCIAYNPEKNEFPQKRSSIYRDAIKLLLEQWDESRPGGRIKRDEIYKNLSRQNKEAMFARIAWGTFTENQYFIEEEHLARMIQVFIKNLPEYQDEKALPDGERILKQIEAQHGILIERAKGVYSFAHLTFQEYFAAKYTFDNAQKGMLGRLVEEHLLDYKWREVILLIVEMLDNSDELLILIHQKNRALLKNKFLNYLLEESHKALKPLKCKFSEESRIAFAAFLILILDFKKWKGKNFRVVRVGAPDMALELSCSLDKTMLTYRSKFIDQDGRYRPTQIAMDTINSNSLDLGLDFKKIESVQIRWELEELDLIQKFFVINVLIIMRCLQSNVYISKPVREKILNEMLLPRREGE